MNLLENHKSDNNLEFRLWLQSELTRRCQRNPNYSLRAFASLLGMDASSVSQILSGKRKVSTKVVNHICQVLDCNPAAKAHFLKHLTSTRTKRNPLQDQSQTEYELLAADAFSFISEWYHYGILELVNVDGFQSKNSWIARSLGITSAEAQIAIERMTRLGLLRLENGKLFRTDKFVTNFSPGMTSSALKNLQRQILEMALQAIENVPQEEKDITSMTMAIDVEKLPEARKVIAQFRRQLCSFLEDGKQSRVYNLGIQLYPVSKKTT